MNSVAVSNVATNTMNEFSPAKANAKPSKDFDAILGKTLASQGHQKQSEKVLKSVKSQKDLKATTDSDVVSEKVSKDTPKIDQTTDLNQTKEVKTEVTKEEVDKIEEAVVVNIAASLGISVVDLCEMMKNLNLTVMDLFSNKGLQQIFNTTFGLENEVDILKNPNAFDAFKEIKKMLQDVLKENGINLEDIKCQLEESQAQVITENTTTTNGAIVTQTQAPASVQVVEVVQSNQQTNITVEIVDARELKGNTEELQTVQVVDPKEAKSDGKESKNESSFQNELENVVQPTVSHKVEVVTAQGIKEMIYQTAGAKEIMNQVVTGVKVALTDMDTTMTFQLKPESLGKIAFSITSQNGVLTGHFVAESSAAKEAIEGNLANLKQTLNDQGIKLDEVKVVIGNTNQFFEKNDQSKNFNHFNKNKRRKMSEVDGVEGISQKVVDLKEAIRIQELDNQERMVDFSA